MTSDQNQATASFQAAQKPATDGNPYMGILEKQRQAFLKNGPTSPAQRKENLSKLSSSLAKHADELISAIQEDFGHRSSYETILAEVLLVQTEIAIAKSKIKKWMKPKRAPISLATLPATGKVFYQPKGVVGVMGAWNYPSFLIFSPLIGVLAAGNHSMIKPPDVTPKTSDVIKKIIESVFEESYVAVITGEVESAIQFSQLPFDHLVYTGNTEVGRQVMMAAARNLTPVTLELGGKSPTIIAEDYSLPKAVSRMMMGKTMNSGQTCIAPDYVLLKEGKEEAFTQAYSNAITNRFPTLVGNDDVSWIVNDRHFKRIQSIIADAREKGATVTQINPNNETIPEGHRIIPHTVITNTSDDMKCMHEEIFGPVLPVKTYKDIDDAIDYVNARPHPLALYYFQNNTQKATELIKRTTSGGACINETMLHLMHSNMPFGGIGNSGTGAYHGFDGFEEFSHKRSVLFQSKAFSPGGMMKGPNPKAAFGFLRKLVSKFG